MPNLTGNRNHPERKVTNRKIDRNILRTEIQRRDGKENHSYRKTRFAFLWREFQVKNWGGLKMYIKMRFTKERCPKLSVEG